MNEHLFTTALYIFSSLVQADAAVLSLGAIFIIYRLQAMDTSYQNMLASLGSGSFAGSVGQHATRIAQTTYDPERAAILINFQGSFYLSFLETVAYTSLWKKRLLSKSTLPFLLLAVHCGLSAVLLLRTASFGISKLFEFAIWTTLDVSTFVILIFFIVYRAYQLLVFEGTMHSQAFENIDRPLPSNYAELRALFPDDHKSFMYRFRLQGRAFYLLIFSKRKDLFSINFLTYSDAEKKILTQKSIDDKSDTELEQTWNDFLQNSSKYLQPSK